MSSIKDNPRQENVIKVDPATLLLVVLAILFIPLVLVGLFAH